MRPTLPPRPPIRLALLTAGLLTAGLLAATPPAAADDALRLTIKDHRFEPSRLEVPAGVKFKLLVRNADDAPEEFESTALRREKVVPAGEEVPILLGPLEKGEYAFVGEYNEDTAKGVLVAK